MSLILKSPDLALLGAQEITVNSAEFSKTTSSQRGFVNYQDNWVKDLSSTSDMTVSFWVYTAYSGALQYIIDSGGLGTTRQFIRLERSSGNTRLFIRHTSNGASDGITYASAYGKINLSSWNHVVYSFDYSTNNLEVAINDVDLSASNAENGVNTFPGTTTADTNVGILDTGDPTTSGNHLFGCLTEFWMKDEYYDVSVESNRRKFISSNGKPVQLPASPLVYLTGNSSTWTNNGTSNLGTQTIDSISDCATSPSD